MRQRKLHTRCVCTGLASPVRAVNAATSAAVKLRRSSNTEPTARREAAPSAASDEHRRLDELNAARTTRTPRIDTLPAQRVRGVYSAAGVGGRAAHWGPLLNARGAARRVSTNTQPRSLLARVRPAPWRHAGRFRPGAHLVTRWHMSVSSVPRCCVALHCCSRAPRAPRQLSRPPARAGAVRVAAAGGAFDGAPSSADEPRPKEARRESAASAGGIWKQTLVAEVAASVRAAAGRVPAAHSRAPNCPPARRPWRWPPEPRLLPARSLTRMKSGA